MIGRMPWDKSSSVQSIVLAVVCALVAGLFMWMAATGVTEWSGSSAAENHYNLLVAGFQSGHLSVNREVPAGLAQLADPYDPVANAEYRSLPVGLHDLSYYKGRLYLYFGVTPALLLFWPWAALTGHYLLQRYAVAIFCLVGFLASVGLVRALGRRYFPEAGVAVLAAGALALGLVTGVPVMLQRAEFWEAAISCGYALVMLALGAVWLALHDPGKRCWWLAAASVALGFAVGARPSLLLTAAILLVPVVLTWSGPCQAGPRRLPWGLLAAAVLPLVVCGLGLMLYNELRFDNPFEFGQHYQLAGDRQDVGRYFSPHYLWFNFCVYFLEPVQWSRQLPFVGPIATPALPPGHAPVDDPFGVLTNLPLLWLALAAPLAWRGRAEEARTTLRGFIVTVALLFGISALVLCLFYGNCSRYEVEFLPALTLLAVIGMLAVERTLAGRPRWRLVFRAVWSLLLAFSVAFTLLAGIDRYADQRYRLGNQLLRAKRAPEAIAQYETALRIKPGLVDAEGGLGNALLHANRVPEAFHHFEEALRLSPDRPEVHVNLANVLSLTGRLPEAIGQYEQALRLEPDYAETHCNLAITLAEAGRLHEAVAHFREALRLKPDYAYAHYNLGVALMQLGQTAEAQEHLREAMRLKPELGRDGP